MHINKRKFIYFITEMSKMETVIKQ